MHIVLDDFKYLQSLTQRNEPNNLLLNTSLLRYFSAGINDASGERGMAARGAKSTTTSERGPTNSSIRKITPRGTSFQWPRSAARWKWTKIKHNRFPADPRLGSAVRKREKDGGGCIRASVRGGTCNQHTGAQVPRVLTISAASAAPSCERLGRYVVRMKGVAFEDQKLCLSLARARPCLLYPTIGCCQVSGNGGSFRRRLSCAFYRAPRLSSRERFAI